MGAIDDSFGAWYIGQQVAILLVGASIVQSWVYLKNSGQDPVLLKTVVLILMLLQATLAALVSAGLYHFLITAIGNPQALTSIPRTLNAEPFISAAVIAIVQWFYAFRLFHLTKSIALLVIVLLLGAAQLGMASAGAAADLNQSGTIVSSSMAKTISCASLVADMLCDAIITVTIVHFLHTHRTGVKSTENMMNTLTNYTLASGFITFVGSCVILATYLALPDTQIYSAIGFLLPHLYTNSLLALLNARRSLRQRSVAQISMTRNTAQPRDSAPLFVPWNNSPELRSGYTSTTMNIEMGSVASHGSHVLHFPPSQCMAQLAASLRIGSIIAPKRWCAPEPAEVRAPAAQASIPGALSRASVSRMESAGARTNPGAETRSRSARSRR